MSNKTNLWQLSIPQPGWPKRFGLLSLHFPVTSDDVRRASIFLGKWSRLMAEDEMRPLIEKLDGYFAELGWIVPKAPWEIQP